MVNKFLLFSFPNEKEFIFLQDRPLERLAVDCQPFEGNQYISIHSNEYRKITASQLKELQSLIQLPQNNSSYQILKKEEYESILRGLIEEMKQEEIPKVIFSRVKKVNGAIDILKTLLQLRENNPNAFIYYVQDPKQAWLGATPEVLLEETEKAYQTMSLAGTLPIEEEWSEKELKEQQIVTEFIIQTLTELNCNFDISPIKDSIQNNFKHLKQTIAIDKENTNYDKVLQLLNPTPAVCGIPRDDAKQLIQKWETNKRELYTGYINVQIPESLPKAYVNLRCAKVYQDAVMIYVGGGITQESDIQKEWRETELKSQIIENSLVFKPLR